MAWKRYLQVHEEEPLFPRTFLGRFQMAMESLCLLCIGVCSLFNWPPDGVVAQGLWLDIYLAILFEMMVVTIPFGILGLWWAIATPEWIRTWLKRAYHHVAIMMFAFLMLGFLTMIAGILGWW